MFHRASSVRRLFSACLFFAALVVSSARETSFRIDPAGSHDVELEDLGNGEWEVRTTGTDPYFYVRSEDGAIDLEVQPTFELEYFSTTGIGRMLVFVGLAIDVPRMVTVPDIGRREAWGPLAVDMTGTLAPPSDPVTSLRVTIGQGPGIVARLRSLRARPATEQEKQISTNREILLEDDRKHADRLRSYLDREFPHRITSVSADSGKITIRGELGAERKNLRLAEVPMWEDITRLENPASLHEIDANGQGGFSITVERSAAKDREILLSGWAVVEGGEGDWQPVSAMRYVEQQRPRAELPPAGTRPLKGIGGCPFDHPDMQELGIESVTLNIILNGFLSSEPGPGRTPYPFAGRTWYVNEEPVARFDRDMLIAAENNWMVSAIILMPPVRQAPEGAWIREAAHPHADPGGIFVLPDFTSREGVNAYAAVMNFVIERYSRPDGKYGRVHHWILHNEINNAFFWATAGNKTVTTYLDLYQKSMRVAWLLTGQYDHHSKPFISLDHGWTNKPDVRSYAGRELMDLLVEFSKKEGDFPWGIAFHPYPQDIANPRTWEDSAAHHRFDTPFLTYRNIEVLDAWVRQPSVAFQGRPREIQLTEQGLNSPDYSGKSLTEQAAGMAYVWEKIKPLETITAFQYHLWADAREEGGLRLGLRKFGDYRDDPHGIKPIWEVYRAIGTDKWEEAIGFAKPVLGIESWDEVRYTGEIVR